MAHGRERSVMETCAGIELRRGSPQATYSSAGHHFLLPAGYVQHFYCCCSKSNSNKLPIFFLIYINKVFF
ncbi:N-terminal, partial [Zea mays]